MRKTTLVILLMMMISASVTAQERRGVIIGKRRGTVTTKISTDALAMNSVEGALRSRWQQLGGAPGQKKIQGSEGLVQTRGGFYREYVNNSRLYYRASDQAVFWVHGHILNRYRELGGAESWLGFPTSDEMDFPAVGDDGRATSFEHGAIYWWPDTGPMELDGAVIVRYTGLYCFGETDNDQQLSGSSADEPYLIFGLPPDPITLEVPQPIRTRIYKNVDAGDSREDNIELFKGWPAPVGMSLTLMEHDVGDAEKKRQAIRDAITSGANKAKDEINKKVKDALEATSKAHTVGVSAAVSPILTPLGGMLVAAALEALWDEFGDDFIEWVNDTLNFQDDQIAAMPFVISAKQLVLAARSGRRENLKGIQWQIESPLMAGDGASYKAYFVVDRANPVGVLSEPVLTQLPTPSEKGQGDWRFCHKCHGMFFDGYPTKGHCPAGGGHEAAGWNFSLPHDLAETPNAQAAWRFCDKCFAMFYDGYADKGMCAAGDGHHAQGYNFVLPHELPESASVQTAWRYCHKCHAMFYDGYPAKGVCPKGGGHEAMGYNFALTHN